MIHDCQNALQFSSTRKRGQEHLGCNRSSKKQCLTTALDRTHDLDCLQNEISDMRDWLKSEISDLKSEITDMKECVEGIGECLKEEVGFNLEEVLYLIRKSRLT